MIEFTLALPIRGSLTLTDNRVRAKNVESADIYHLSAKLTGFVPSPMRIWFHYDYESESCNAVIQCEDAQWASDFQAALTGKTFDEILDIEVEHAKELESKPITEPTGEIRNGVEISSVVTRPDLPARQAAVEANLRRGFTKTDAAVAEWKRVNGRPVDTPAP